MEKIVLASKSLRRKEILTLAGIPFDVIAFDTAETFPENLNPSDAAMYIAKNKSLLVRDSLYNQSESSHHFIAPQIILAADTIVVHNNNIIGKPESRADAIDILLKLSSCTHEVVTGVSLLFKDQEISFSGSTKVEFNKLSLAQIEYYVDTFQPYDKAGAYAIQEWIGAIGIKSIHGDYYNVMGLPINRVVKEINLLNT